MKPGNANYGRLKVGGQSKSEVKSVSDASPKKGGSPMIGATGTERKPKCNAPKGHGPE